MYEKSNPNQHYSVNELIYKYLEERDLGRRTGRSGLDFRVRSQQAEFCEIRALWSVRDRNSVENDPQRISNAQGAARPHRRGCVTAFKRARIIRWAGWAPPPCWAVALVVGGYLVGHDMHKAAMIVLYVHQYRPQTRILRLLDGTRRSGAGIDPELRQDVQSARPHGETRRRGLFDVASDRDHPFS